MSCVKPTIGRQKCKSQPINRAAVEQVVWARRPGQYVGGKTPGADHRRHLLISTSDAVVAGEWPVCARTRRVTCLAVPCVLLRNLDGGRRGRQH